MILKSQATIDDLSRIEGKAELVNGEIVQMPPTGATPGFAGDEIYSSLRAHVRRTGVGRAVGDNKAFRVDLPNRGSFSPDAAYYTGPTKDSMKFYEGAPVVAVEVRSEGDYGPAAECEMAAKRADYFAAGTLIVWDVDLLGNDLICAFHAAAPDQPHVFRRGDVANAEPAVPGWSMRVADLFES